ncbi:hypothetical protein [Streptomyces sp. B6B3]|uniref:hypothetical protein n=1 Tax=Streptomyces sp. B6B3 TaxID=3153570 RepID=UPI00325C38F5
MDAHSVQPLYGQRPLLNGLVPRMVMGNEDPDAARGLPVPGPIVQLLGGRLSGKSALLRTLRDTYAGRTPMVWADLTDPAFGQTGLANIRAHVGRSRRASLVTHLLYLLAAKLGEDVPGMRRIEFPRLSLGLLMATAWQPGSAGGTNDGGDADSNHHNAPDDADADDDEGVLPPDYRAALGRLVDWLNQQPTIRSSRERRRRFAALFDVLVSNLAPVVGLPDAIAGLVVDTARPLLESAKLDEAPFLWWGQRLRTIRGVPHTDNLWCLIAFHSLFLEDGTRADAEEDLVAAFLDDIDAFYTRRRLRNGTKRPLVLLDNAHGAPGPQFLTLLARGYDDRTTRPVVLATLLDDGQEPRPAPLRSIADGHPDHGDLRLALPPLTGAEIRAMLNARRLPTHLEGPVARFSGGRAGCVRRLVDAAVGEAERPGFPTRAPDADDDAPTFAEHLLEELLPDERVRDDLTRLAPALDGEAAHRLWRAQALPHAHGSELDAEQRFTAVRRELTAGHWDPRPWPWPAGELIGGSVPYVADRALRALLLHRLTASPSAAAAQRWTNTQLFLRAQYAPRGLPPEAAEHSVPYLHHTLALGDMATVVRCLHHRLTRSRPEDWLAAVNAIGAAPRPPAGVAPVSDGADCPACATPYDEDAHTMIARLVDHVWLHAAPLAPVPTGEAVPETIASAWLVLHLRNGERGVLEGAGSAWHNALRSGKQAPDLPIPRGTRP